MTRQQRVHLGVAIFIATALTLRFLLTAFWPADDLDPALLVRLERFFSYFTIQSNLVALLASMAVVRARPLDTATGRALRLAGLVGMTVTCIVYIVMLSGDADNQGLDEVANLMLHYVGPPLFVGAWLIFGPFWKLGARDVMRMMLWPLLWVVWTLLHGAVTDWYPYPFIDVVEHGYAKVFVNIAVISVFALTLAAACTAVANLRRADAQA